MWRHGGEYEEYCPIRKFRRKDIILTEACEVTEVYIKNIALYGRFGEPAASIFGEYFDPPPGLSVLHWLFRISQLCLFVCPCVCIVLLPRGHETLVNLCWTAWRNTPEGCVRQGIRLWEGTCLLKMTPNTWLMTLVGLERASMWRGALHIIFINFAHDDVFRENIVCPVLFRRSALYIF